jgi:hypothetical protein
MTDALSFTAFHAALTDSRMTGDGRKRAEFQSNIPAAPTPPLAGITGGACDPPPGAAFFIPGAR